MIPDSGWILITFVLYFICMFWIGLYFYRRTKNLSDYVLGGRKLGSWVIAMSAQASDMSGWLLMGLPGLAYLTGLQAVWIAAGLSIGTYFNWKFIAKRLRVYTEIAGDSITLPDYFENRFKDTTKILRVISSIFILIFFLIYTSSGFVAGAKLFSFIFAVPYDIALLISVLVIISYTFLGGFSAVCWTDFFQGLLMFFAVIIIPAYALYLIGGINAGINDICTENPNLLNIFKMPNGSTLGLITIISSLAWGLGYLGQPHILVRFMAISSSDKIKKSRLIAMIWVIISLACSVIIGVLGIICLNDTLSGTEAETVFIGLIYQLFSPYIGGIFLAAILAAIMSTADSQLLVTSSAIAEDFYKVMFRRRAGNKELVWVGRIAVIVVAVLAALIALNPNSSVLDLVSYAWAGFGATFGPLVLISLFWKRMTVKGAVAGIIIGGCTALIWKQLHGAIFDLYEIVPGFLFSSLAIFVVSLLDKKPKKEVYKEFNEVNKLLH